MAAPTFFDKGTLDAENSGSSVSPVDFPASIAANDIAVLAVGCGGGTGVDFTTPTSQGSWALLGTSLNSAGQSTAWYWLRLAGTEGSESVDANTTFGNTNGGYGQIFVFRGCITTGNPFEGVGNDGTAAQTTPDSTACTTTGADRLVVCITQLDDNVDASSGYPPAGWADSGAGFSSSGTGSDWGTKCMVRTEASATTVASAVVGTWGTALRYRTITFALIPEPAAIDLTVADAVQAQSTDVPTLTQVHQLVVQDAAQLQSADNVVLETGATTLTVQDAAQAQSVESVALTQVHQLIIADAVQGQLVESPALTQQHNLTVVDTAQTQSADTVALTQVHQLVVADASQAQTADNVVLQVGGVSLTVQDANQTQSIDTLALTQTHVLAVADAVQSQTVDQPALTQIHQLAVADIVQAQSTDDVVLWFGEIPTPAGKPITVPAGRHRVTVLAGTHVVEAR